MKTKITLLLGASVIAALALWQWDWDASGVEVWIGEYAWLGALVYVGLLAASVVVCPFPPCRCCRSPPEVMVSC